MDKTVACRDINQLKPLAQSACKLFLQVCKERNIPIFITETYRPQERQNWLYEQGRSREGAKVTWTLKSNHTSRMAWDIAVSPPNQLYDKNIIAKAGVVARELGITWGGDWKQADTPHFEIDLNWRAKALKDDDLEKAVQVLVLKNVIGSPAAWISLDKINLKNVPSLLFKMGGVAKLVQDGVIGSPGTWESGKYSKDNVRSLIIKYAAWINKK